MTTVAPEVPRWRALDAFRGLAVIGMLLVNNPGNHDAVHAELQHSAWHGCTIADLVFPAFLFVVGITTSLSPNKRVWKRAGVIFAIGLVLNWFPFYQSGAIAGIEHPGFVDRVIARLLILRIPGVLQRIAVAYAAAAFISRRASSRQIVFVIVAILLGYWATLTLLPVPGEGVIGSAVLGEPSRTIVAHVDRALFDWTQWGLGNHLWDSAGTWDPEGALSTLPAIATVLLGVLFGRQMRTEDSAQRRRAILAGAALIIVGLAWSLVFPLNKSLWTSSFVLFTAGVSALTLAVIPGSRLIAPLIVFGENPLLAYAGSEIARRILHSSIKIPSADGRLGVDEWTSRTLERIGLSAPAASLAWALLFTALWWLGLRRLSRRRLYLRA
jgi:predicted acyltransferase